MEGVCRITADVGERRCGVIPALGTRGVVVRVAHLPVADYDLGGGILVERKSVADLHLSLQRGRFWPQIGALRRNAQLPHLLVEGRDLDVANGVRPDAVRGACLAVVAQGVALLRTAEPADSARWLHLLALRATGARLPRHRPPYAQRLKPRPGHPGEAMLAAVPGISVVRARALLDRFGSVRSIAAADRNLWLEVRGIGPAAARALERALS